jgi:hypothetical protein
VSGGAKPFVERAFFTIKRLTEAKTRTRRADRRMRTAGDRIPTARMTIPAHPPLDAETLRLTKKGAVFALGSDNYLVHDRYASSHGPHADVVILHGSGCDDRGVRRSTRAVQVRDVERLIRAGCIATVSADAAPGDGPTTDGDHGGCPTPTSSHRADDS